MARKQYNTQTFKPGRTIEIVAWTEDTNYGFRHLAQLSRKVGSTWHIMGQAKACYYNRTWEEYDYQSVIKELVARSTIRNKAATMKKIDNKALGRVDDQFKAVGAVMALGDLFGATNQDKNNWKRRMLKAGVPEGAISLPDDWDQLSEDEKTKRLDRIIEEFTK